MDIGWEGALATAAADRCDMHQAKDATHTGCSESPFLAQGHCSPPQRRVDTTSLIRQGRAYCGR
jgi:hypothetical protein